MSRLINISLVNILWNIPNKKIPTFSFFQLNLPSGLRVTGKIGSTNIYCRQTTNFFVSPHYKYIHIYQWYLNKLRPSHIAKETQIKNYLMFSPNKLNLSCIYLLIYSYNLIKKENNIFSCQSSSRGVTYYSGTQDSFWKLISCPVNTLLSVHYRINVGSELI